MHTSRDTSTWCPRWRRAGCPNTRPAYGSGVPEAAAGAKPGTGGVLPGAKVDAEIARDRDVPEGETVVSPPYHQVFSTPRELVRFIARTRELSGASRPVSSCASVHGTSSFFVDGAEGRHGFGATRIRRPIGTPLTEGLMTVHNALVGAGLRDRIRIGASGKIATGADLVNRLVQGADCGNAARAMMFAVGRIQARRCHTNTCPVGVTPQDPRRARALDVGDKAARVRRLQEATVGSALQIMASMGVTEWLSPSGCWSSRPPTGRPPTPTDSPSESDSTAAAIRKVNSCTEHDHARPGSEKYDPGRAVVMADRAVQEARVSGDAAS
ncbi:glutamate synthase-related protein [Streptomyces galilaeus]